MNKRIVQRVVDGRREQRCNWCMAWFEMSYFRCQRSKCRGCYNGDRKERRVAQ